MNDGCSTPARVKACAAWGIPVWRGPDTYLRAAQLWEDHKPMLAAIAAWMEDGK